MHKRTRVLNAMEGKPVDRVPVGFYTHFMSLEDQRNNGVQGQVDWFLQCDMDCLCIETDGYMEYPTGRTMKTLKDWTGLSPHSAKDHYIQGQLDRASRIVDGIKDGGIFYMIYTPFSTIKHTIGGENRIMEYYREGKEILDDAMKIIEEDTFRLMELLIKETGIDGFFISLQNAEIGRFSKEEYCSYLKPWDHNLLSFANSLSPHNITHMCSWTGVPNQLDLWVDYDYKTVNWAVTIEQEMDLSQGRRFFKPGTTVMGGFDSSEKGILYTGTEAEIKAYTRHQLDLAGQLGTILCGDCSVQTDTDPTHVRWVVEACQEYASLRMQGTKGHTMHA